MLAADGADAAGPSFEELRARAAVLIPRLRERQAQTEALRAIPDETIAEFRDAGLFSLFRPARYRGIELPFRAFVEMGALIGRGCGSSSWVLNNLLSHNWMLGFWPVEAQDEIWRDDPDTLVGSAFIFPCGSARRVDGGYRVSGRWPFSSGIDPSRWTMLAAILRDPQGNPAEHRFFVVPQSDYKVIDTWHVMGLIGTGSKDVAVEDVFVPEHRTINAEAGKGGPGPGGIQNTSPLFRLPWFGLFSFVNAGTVLGIAQGAVEQFIDATRKRAATYTGKGLAELATMQVRIAEAAALVDTAEAMMLKDCDECWDIVAAGDQPTLEAKVRWRRDGAYAAGMCVRAVDLVFTGAGGGAIHEENPLQRSFRDVHAACGHIGLNWDFNGAMFGRVTLGLPPDAPLL